MKAKTLKQVAAQVVDLESDCTSSIRYKRLNEFQQMKLAAANMRDLGELAYEVVTDSGFMDSIVSTLMEILESDNQSDINELKIKLADILIDGAIEESLIPSQKAIEEAEMQLSINRQFRNTAEEDSALNLYQDNIQRTHDMRLAMR